MPLRPLDELRARVREHHARHDAARKTARASAMGAPSRAKGGSPRKPGAISSMVNAWWTRLLTSIYEGSLSQQEAEYESGETGRDYLWNTVGVGVWGMVFPALTVVSTQLAGVEQAGRFSMAFVTGTLLMIVSNCGARNFQVSDIDERSSFASYQVNRWLTSAIALVAGILYCTLRDYGAAMMTLSLGVYVYKIVDGLADVYEGRLQQADKLYLAGISQALRSVAVVAVFSVLLFITRDIAVAAVGMGAAAVASLALVSIPLALLETEPSAPWRIHEVSSLTRHCFPLFAALFLFNLIESMPKFVMEGLLPYDNQLYFNALFFPAQGILLAIGFIYKPQLLRLASIWSNPRKRKRFDAVVIAVMAVIVAITAGTALVMGTIGIPVMSLVYGVDFEPFRGLALLMVAAGGITAAIDFLYAIVTVLRRQGEVMRIYLIAFVASAIVPVALIALMGLTGAVLSYLLVMALLLAMLTMEYVGMRKAIERERNPFG